MELERFTVLYRFSTSDGLWKVLPIDGKQLTNRDKAMEGYANMRKAGWPSMVAEVIIGRDVIIEIGTGGDGDEGNTDGV